jgi:hypothetical protein
MLHNNLAADSDYGNGAISTGYGLPPVSALLLAALNPDACE